MIDNNIFTILESKNSSQKMSNSRDVDVSNSKKNKDFSNFMGRTKDNSPEKVDARESKRKIPDEKNSKDPADLSTKVKSDDAQKVENRKELIANNDDSDTELNPQEAENNELKNVAASEDGEEQSTTGLMNLLLQGAIESNIEDSVDGDKDEVEAVSVLQSQTGALEALIAQSISGNLTSEDIVDAQSVTENTARLSPELIKLIVGSEKDNGSFDKFNGLSARQEALSQVKLTSVDDVLNINQENNELLTKFVEKLDLDKTKGELLFQNRLNGDKALLDANFTDSTLAKVGIDGSDKNILFNAAATTERSNPLSASPALKMNTPVTNPEWGAEFGKKIQMLVKSNVQYAEIRMDPPELGRIQIKINIVQDQANISFTALHANVRDAIEINMTRLREMLGDTGMQLGETDVGSQFQQQTNQRSDENEKFAFQQSNSEIGIEDEGSELPPTTIQRSIDGVIDYFA